MLLLIKNIFKFTESLEEAIVKEKESELFTDSDAAENEKQRKMYMRKHPVKTAAFSTANVIDVNDMLKELTEENGSLLMPSNFSQVPENQTDSSIGSGLGSPESKHQNYFIFSGVHFCTIFLYIILKIKKT